MTTELQFLVASIILGLVHLVAASHLISFQYGYRWTASSREEPVPPLSGLANRVDQATTNFLETFLFSQPLSWRRTSPIVTVYLHYVARTCISGHGWAIC